MAYQKQSIRRGTRRELSFLQNIKRASSMKEENKEKPEVRVEEEVWDGNNYF